MKSIVFALLASLVWGAAPVLFKLALRGEIPPIVALVFHNFSAFLLAVSVAVLAGMNLSHPIKEVILIAVGGIMSGFLGVFFFFKAVKDGDVSVVAPIASSSPLWASLIAFFLLGEPFSWLRAFGILLVICGIVLITLSSGK